MPEFDISTYLGVFLDEVDEQLLILDTEILHLEKDPGSCETIQNIFRAAHTLKGSSASMGFEKMKDFTHHLENIFDQIRQSKLEVTPELINVIFDSIDFIKKLKDAIVNGKLEEIDIQPFIQQLGKFSDGQMPSSPPRSVRSDMQKQDRLSIRLEECHKNVILNGIYAGYHALEITIKLVQDALMKNVRALLIHNNLKEAGEIIAASPALEVMEKDEGFDGEMVFVLLTMQTKQELLENINQISDIRLVDINEITETGVSSEVRTVAEMKGKGAASSQIMNRQAAPEEKALQPKAKINPTVRVDVDKLEHLMNLVGELVIDQTRLVDVRGRFANRESNLEGEYEVLDEVTNHLSRVITELQEGMMKTRMLPIEQLFNRFPRMVRDTAIKASKDIEFVMQGKETELDRTLIEEISDPIIHLLRNAVDHGIESPEERERLGKPVKGKVILRAAHEENHIVISIIDDGKGIDPAKIRQTSVEKGMISEEEARRLSDKDSMFLIFKSGISTAERITDISGRGVGMDIVRSHIEKLNGIIDIESVVGRGTTFTIKLPLTLAIIRSLLVKFGPKTFAIPLVNVLEIIRLNRDEIQMVKDQEVGMVRGRVLPLVRMKERLGIADQQDLETKKREFVIVVGIADKRIGIIADKMIGNQEIVIKSLGPYIGSPPFIAGATIMGDGNVALILDISTVVREHGTQELDHDHQNVKRELEDERQLVTFKLGAEEYGLEIQRAKDIISVPPITQVVDTPEHLLGVINLRGTMLPVMDLRIRFNLPSTQRTKKSRIIVVENDTQDVGFLVDEVTQVLKTNHLMIEQPKEFSHYNRTNLIKGICKLDDRVVLMLEFDRILAAMEVEDLKEPVTHSNHNIY
ncbi:chemotaxis protein CheW [Paenibacillus sp. YPG26]|uniref:chemotaxis protein CheW n=1 Tax=Paenibacillus sp. YPG26 TaxID=2878915 RepID=UPI00203BFC61|nr:chemotaxis protein CheW [Paenibacillus sp. YPG26]USB31752.1 chemotaxis protein CheW [Paenibacillus sp. YPG26]